jgi:hypothetical protein
LLRLPCQHVFHACCAEPWLEREAWCPVCRNPTTRMRKCTRICIRDPNKPAGSPRSKRIHPETTPGTSH